MKFQIRQRDRRALLGLIGAIAIYGLFAGLVLPAYDRFKEASTTAAEKEQQLQKYRQTLQRKGHFSQLLDQARKSVAEAESRLIRGDNASLASVELQNLVEEAAKKENIELSQKNISPAKKKDDYFNEITMTISFDSTPNQVTTFLADLRNAPKFVTVRNVQLAPAEQATAPPKKGDVKKTVRVNLTVGAVLSNPEKKG